MMVKHPISILHHEQSSLLDKQTFAILDSSPNCKISPTTTFKQQALAWLDQSEKTPVRHLLMKGRFLPGFSLRLRGLHTSAQESHCWKCT